MAVETLLCRLDGVKPTGPGRWVARCPAHSDKRPSLSIRETAEGKVLLHDFGGCAPADILAALELPLATLFPNGGRAQRQGGRRRDRIPAGDLLVLASREVHVAAIIAADFLHRRNLDEATWQRLAKCVARLGNCSAEIRA